MTSRSRPNSRRMGRFGLVLVASLALGAFGASSASALSFSPEAPAKFPVSLTLNTTEPGSVSFNWGSSGGLQCVRADGTGQLTSGTSGEMTITYKGCGPSPGTEHCTTPGQPEGNMVAHVSVTPVYLDAAKTKVGLKLSPIGSSVYAECIYPTSGIRYTGSVIGSIGNTVGSTMQSLHLLQGWGSAWNEQQYQQIEGSGTKYHLTGAIWSTEEGGWEVSGISTALWVQNFIWAGARLTLNA